VIDWLLMALICVISAVVIIWPLISPKVALGDESARMKMNVTVYDQRLQDIERDYAQGVMNSTDYQSHLVELKRNLLEAHGKNANHQRTEPSKPVMSALIFLILLVMGFGFYMQLARTEVIGDWHETLEQVEPKVIAFIEGRDPGAMDEKSVGDFILVMQYLLQSRAELSRGWGMFSDLMSRLGAQPQALVAARKAYLESPSDLEAVARYVHLDMAANEGRMMPRANAILASARVDHPGNTSLLMLQAMGYTGNEQWSLAEATWRQVREKMVAHAEPSNVKYQNALAVVDRQLALARQQQSVASDQVVHPKNDLVIDQAAVKVEVHGPESLLETATASSRVFIVAKAEGVTSGPPLAVRRIRASHWPIEITLTENDAMMPNINLATSRSVVISAWWSSDGKIGQDQPIKTISEVVDPLNQPIVRLTLQELE